MLAPGQLVKDYRILRQIGQGGFAQVYEAEHHALGSKVALKLLTVAATTADELQKHHEQFLLEARTLAALRHRNIAQVHDYFVAPQGHVIVMELIQGHTLEQLLHRRGAGFTWDDVSGYAAQMLDALTYLHSQSPPVILRDITHGNVMLDEDGRIVLIDFGLVKQLHVGVPTRTVIRGAGTPGFAPIEQYGADAAATDQRSDIYSLGALLYCLLAGKAPPEAVALYRKVAHLQDLPQVNPSVTRELDQALRSLMAPEPDQRPQSVGEVRSLLGGVPTQAAGAAPAHASAPPATTRPLTLTALTRTLLPPPPPAPSSYSLLQVVAVGGAAAGFLFAQDSRLTLLLGIEPQPDSRLCLGAFVVTYSLLALLYWYRADDESLGRLLRKSAWIGAAVLMLDVLVWWRMT